MLGGPPPALETAPFANLRRALDGLGDHTVRNTLLVVLAATVAGYGSGFDPRVVVAGVAGLVLVSVILVNVTAGLMVFVFVAFLEFLPTTAGAPSMAKLVGLFLVIGWLGIVAVGRQDDRLSLDFLASSTALSWMLVLFLGWVLASLLWAEDVGVAESTLLRYTLNFALFPIVFVAIRTPRHVASLYAVFIAGALFAAVVGMASSGGLSAGGDNGDSRLSGAGLNPNQLGALLGVAAVLGGVLFCYRQLTTPVRILAAVGSCLCVVSLIMTGSRGALVGLVASLAATPILVGRGRRLGATALVICGGAASAVWVALVVPHDLLQRLIKSSGGGSGRVDLWTIGLRMFHDHPLTGVGAGNFPITSIHYLLLPGRISYPQYIIDQPKVTHNIYLQVIAELGLVGIALFGSMILLSVIAGLKATRAFQRQGDTGAELLTRGLLIALTGLLVAYFFSSQLYGKQLYVLLALAPALLGIARRGAEPSQ